MTDLHRGTELRNHAASIESRLSTDGIKLIGLIYCFNFGGNFPN